MKTAKRQRIMKAAEALFSGGRFHEITMEDVARKAGVGKGTLYRYFKNKDELFFEVSLSGYDELCEMVRTERERSAEFRECLVNVCRRISEFHGRRRRLAGMMQAEERRALLDRGGNRAVWLGKRGELVAALEQILKEGRAEGRIRGDLPLPTLALFLLGMLRIRGRESLTDGDVKMNRAAVVELFLHGAGEGGKR